jgi:hypothetical protein
VYFAFPTSNVWLSKPTILVVYSLFTGPTGQAGLQEFLPLPAAPGIPGLPPCGSGSGIFLFQSCQASSVDLIRLLLLNADATYSSVPGSLGMAKQCSCVNL